MKLSIIFGVVHMMFGVCVSVVNIVHFKKYSNIIFQFLPQLLFLVLLFTYMAALMFIKWVTYAATTNPAEFGTSPTCAPSVLVTFINMMLFNKAKVSEGCSEYMFPGQEITQKVFIFVALACIPLMLFGKPLYILATKKKPRNNQQHTNGSASQDIELQGEALPVPSTSDSHAAADPHGEDTGFGEIMIISCIHTIEYVLSTVSHTASYLRLWALSLAHAQLSEVLWTQILHMGFGAEEGDFISSLKTFAAFGAWSFFTIAILVMMEGLSAFLHTLRLHWVEFMSKFYEGQGHLFQPFCFKSILDADETEE